MGIFKSYIKLYIAMLIQRIKTSSFSWSYTILYVFLAKRSRHEGTTKCTLVFHGGGWLAIFHGAIVSGKVER